MMTKLFYLAVLVLHAGAQPGTQKSSFPERPEEPRSVTVTRISQNEIRILSQADAGGQQYDDEVVLDIENSGSLKYTYQYQVSAQSRMSFEIAFTKMFEYARTGTGFARYAPATDTIVGQYELGTNQNQWQGVTNTTEQGVHRYRHCTVGDVFCAILAFGEDTFTLPDGTIVPTTAMKLELQLNYQYQVGNGTFLALEARVATQQQSRFQNRSGDSSGNMTEMCFVVEAQKSHQDGNFNQARFTWATTVKTQEGNATVYDNSQEVNAGTSTQNALIFSFGSEAPHDIVWDPIFDLAGAESDATAVIPHVAILLLLLAIMVM